MREKCERDLADQARLHPAVEVNSINDYTNSSKFSGRRRDRC